MPLIALAAIVFSNPAFAQNLNGWENANPYASFLRCGTRQPTEIEALLTPEDERWRIEDIACARTGCSLTGFKYLQSLLNDKKNQNRSVKTLFYEMRDYEKKRNEYLLTPLAQKKAGGI